MHQNQAISKLAKLILIVYLLIVAFQSNSAYADNLASPDFKIQMGTINITGGEKSGGGYKLSDTVGQTAQGQFDSTGYRVKAGFQYVRSTIPFSFTISNLNIDFGTLVPNTPATASNTLRVTSGSAYGYTVKAIEDHTLQTSAGQNIADTSCNASTPCDINSATAWNHPGRYGLGYNMSGTDVDTSIFIDSSYYRPFANNFLGHNPVTVMTKSGVTTSAGSTATVTYTILIPGSQPAGKYQNIVQYIAVPSY